MRLFKEVDTLKSDLMCDPDNVNHGTLIESTIRACENKLSSIVMSTPNDQELGEKLREMFKFRLVTVKISAESLLEVNKMENLSELVNYLGLHENTDDVVSVEVVTDLKTMAPIVNILFKS